MKYYYCSKTLYMESGRPAFCKGKVYEAFESEYGNIFNGETSEGLCDHIVPFDYIWMDFLHLKKLYMPIAWYKLLNVTKNYK